METIRAKLVHLTERDGIAANNPSLLKNSLLSFQENMSLTGQNVSLSK